MEMHEIFQVLMERQNYLPFLKFGQIHVETIWKKCQDIKVKNIGYRKYINELGWREFSHSLINYFPQMLKVILEKILIIFLGLKMKST